MRVQICDAGIERIREAIVVNAMTDLKWGYKTLLKYESDEHELMMQCNLNDPPKMVHRST